MVKHSPVWNHFKELADGSVQCKHCLRKYKGSGNSTLRKHVEKDHKMKVEDVVEAAKINSQRSISDLIQGHVVPLDVKQKLDRLAFNLILHNNLPFLLSESEEMKELMFYKCRGYVPPSANQVSNQMLTEAVEDTKKELRMLLRGQFVAMTADGWTALNGKISLYNGTSHSVDKNFNRHNEVIAATPCGHLLHTSSNLADLTNAVLADYEIPNHLFVGFVHDSAKNMMLAGKLLMCPNEDFSIACLAHIFNLIVRDCEKSSSEVNAVLSKIRKIAGFFHHSPYAGKQLEENQADGNRRRIPMDVITRWNSTYEMAVEAVKQSVAVNATLVKLSRASKKKWNGPECLTSNDLALLDGYTTFTKEFYDHTKGLCDDGATIAMYVPCLAMALAHIRRLIEKETHPDVRRVGNFLQSELAKRSLEPMNNDFLKEAATMDPRFFRKALVFDEVQWDAAEKSVAKCIVEFKESAKRKNTSETEKEPEDEELRDDPHSDADEPTTSWDLLNVGQPKPKKQRSEPETLTVDVLFAQVQSEFAHYKTILADSKYSRYREQKSSPFTFWKDFGSEMPLLSWVARAYLTVPPTSVNSERLFSRAAILYENKRRNRLLLKKAENCLLLVSRKAAKRLASERSLTESEIVERDRIFARMASFETSDLADQDESNEDESEDEVLLLRDDNTRLP